jgi:heat shock protein HslJ
MTPFRSLAGAAALALLGACSTMTTAAPPSLDGTAWMLESLPGRTLVDGPRPTLAFEGDRVSGSDGCNRIMGTFAVRGDVLEIPARLAGTQMACPPPQMEQARAYAAALAGGGRYRIEGDRLELLAADGTVRATFARISQALAGTRWNVTQVNNGRQAVVGIVDGTQPTLEFGDAGTVAGSAGCNRYTANFAQDGASVTIGRGATTRKACPEPAGAMAQEQAFLAALATVATARVDGDRLELRTADGALAVGARRMP